MKNNIKCDVETCKHNDCNSNCCKLKEIKISCTCNNDSCKKVEETICENFKEKK